MNSDSIIIGMGKAGLKFSKAEIGKIGIVPKSPVPLYLNQRVGMINEVKRGGLIYTYILYKVNDIKKIINNRASGVAQPNISAKDIEEINIIIPDDNILNQFSKIIEPLIDKMIENLSEIQTLTKIRDTLLPKLITGKIRVKV